MPDDRKADVFRLDADAEQLWHEDHEVPLSPKSLRVLRYFIEHAGRLLDRSELLSEIWGDVHVTDDALRYTIRQIRKALGDNVGTPVFVETTPRRGWRFIGRAVRTGPQAWLIEASGRQPVSPHPALEDRQAPFVGRETEASVLMERLARARTGTRELVLVSGEAGVGKTRLIEAFLDRIAGEPELFVARGQCVEHYGEGEAYRPALETLERLCEVVGGQGPVAILRRYAPMWLAELPALTDPAERTSLRTQLAGASQGRMLREFARALEELSRTCTLVLWIDDLHWSDRSTLDLLTLIAQRAEPAKLLIIGTYRPAEAGDAQHPLVTMRRDLEVHGHCHHHALEFLTVEAVEDYLRQRLATDTPVAFAPELARFVQERTEGNPLFMVSVIDHLISRAILVQDTDGWRLDRSLAALEAPASVRQLLARDLDRLPRLDREILQVASLAGMSFSAAAPAAGLAIATEDVETRCEALARTGRFLLAAGSESWNDGTIASRYSFIHALHRDVLAADLPAAQRARAHHRIGCRKEAGHGDHTATHAAELAQHFEEGRDHQRAIRYLALAGDLAARRYANREATEHLRRALRLLPEIPAGTERDQHELMLRLAISAPLAAVEGYASPDLETNLRRLEELGRTFDESSEFFPVLLGLWSLHIVRADLPTACDIGGRLLRIAEREAQPLARLQAHRVLGHSLFYQGDLSGSRHHLEQALACYDTSTHQRLDYSYGDDPVVLCHSYFAWALWFLGYPEQATRMTENAIIVGRALAHPPSLAFGMIYGAMLHHFRRDTAAAEAQAEAVVQLARDEGMALWLALGTIIHGWALADRGLVDRGVAEMADGLTAWKHTGADLGRPYFLCLVGEAYGRAGRIDLGLDLITEADALITRTGQHVFAPERLRVEGELLLAKARANGGGAAPSGHTRAETCFREAIAIARQQGARATQLRAALGLAEMLQDTGDPNAARDELSVAHDFDEGLADRDLRTAHTLLRTLR